MLTEVAEKPLPKLSETEQREMDEERRTRSTLRGASREQYSKNRNRYVRWFSKRLGFRLHLTKSRRVEGDVRGEFEMRPGLSVKFNGGELILDRQDADFDLIDKRLREHHYFSLKHLICVDDLDAEEKKRTTRGSIGVNKRHQLRKIGIMSDKTAAQIMSVMGVKTQKDYDALAKKAKGQAEEIEKLKDPNAGQRLKDLEAEVQRLKGERDARERRNVGNPDAGRGPEATGDLGRTGPKTGRGPNPS